MEIKTNKAQERKKYKLIREKASQLEREKVKTNVELFVESFYKTAFKERYISIYWPLNNEIDIRSLKFKYPLALPKCKQNKCMEFHVWDDSPLENDYEGIPSPANHKALSFNEISLILVPCLAMDKTLLRLGYGGGYYDKLRSNKHWRSIKIIGVLTSNCISENLLPKAKWDIELNGFITEKGIYV